MEQYRTEEEQVEALKKWWEENGRSTIVAVIVALGLGFACSSGSDKSDTDAGTLDGEPLDHWDSNTSTWFATGLEIPFGAKLLVVGTVGLSIEVDGTEVDHVLCYLRVMS